MGMKRRVTPEIAKQLADEGAELRNEVRQRMNPPGAVTTWE